MPGYDMRSTYSGVAHSLAMLRIPMWGYETEKPSKVNIVSFVTNPHVGL